MKFKTKYKYNGLPSKGNIVDLAWQQIKSTQGLSKYDSSNDANIIDVLNSVYEEGVKRGKQTKKTSNGILRKL